MKRTVRVLPVLAIAGVGLWAAPASADPAYPPTGGGGGGGVVVPPAGGGGGGGQVVTPPAGGGGGVNLPTTGADIRDQMLLGVGAGALGAALIVVAAARRRPRTALA